MNTSQLSERQRERIQTAARNVPFGDLVGMKLESVGPGVASMSLTVRKELLQNNGVVHGGAIATLMDSAAAFAVIPLLQEDETATTVDLTINYLRPLKDGAAEVSARVLREGSRLIVLSAEVLDEIGNLVATGLTTYIRLAKR